MNPNLSWWEREGLNRHADFGIVGGGITGLSAAYFLKTRVPTARVVVLEKGARPEGATVRSAGFACFGSISELVSDVRSMGEAEAYTLAGERFKGLSLLREIHGDEALEFQACGGIEVFFKEDKENGVELLAQLETVNRNLKDISGIPGTVFREMNTSELSRLNFNQLELGIINGLEGALHPQKLWNSLLGKCLALGIEYRAGIEVHHIDSGILAGNDFSLPCGQILIANNAFAQRWFPDEIKPARAQVWMSEPLSHPFPPGTFHHHEGFNYFRGHGGRLLLGGGRHIHPEAETTFSTETTEEIEQYLIEDILPRLFNGQPPKMVLNWAGTMGIGNTKQPKYGEWKPGVWTAVRMGGMGIALGTKAGQQGALHMLG